MRRCDRFLGPFGPPPSTDMTGRRILYSLSLVGVFCFCIAYQKWLAWFLLYALLGLPVFSLLVSLPAMVTARFRLELPETVPLGQSTEIAIPHNSSLPTPPWRCKLLVERPMTGERWKLRAYDELPTSHCGVLKVKVRKARIYDYMGLVGLPIRLDRRLRLVTVEPEPVPMAQMPSLDSPDHQSWKPKPGGGFAENHELRLYRPGDSIQQIHWKLSAKTGSLILREPMEPIYGTMLLRMDLKGSNGQLDILLGQLLWLGQRLLGKGISFRIQCLTGNGAEQWVVDSTVGLHKTMAALMACPRAVRGSLRSQPEPTQWQFFIGGDGNEG